MAGQKERGGTSRFLQARREERAGRRIEILRGERWNRLRAVGEICQNVGRKGKCTIEGQHEMAWAGR